MSQSSFLTYFNVYNQDPGNQVPLYKLFQGRTAILEFERETAWRTSIVHARNFSCSGCLKISKVNLTDFMNVFFDNLLLKTQGCTASFFIHIFSDVCERADWGQNPKVDKCDEGV